MAKARPTWTGGNRRPQKSEPRTRWMALILTILSLAVPALAQESNFIQGTATDSSGAPVYGALVVVEAANGTRYTTVTDEKGSFRIASLNPGNYKIKISANDLSAWTASN